MTISFTQTNFIVSKLIILLMIIFGRLDRTIIFNLISLLDHNLRIINLVLFNKIKNILI